MKSEKHTQEKRKNPTVKWGTGIMVRSVYTSGLAFQPIDLGTYLQVQLVVVHTVRALV